MAEGKYIYLCNSSTVDLRINIETSSISLKKIMICGASLLPTIPFSVITPEAWSASVDLALKWLDGHIKTYDFWMGKIY